jgi:hypothetical protein
MGTPRTEPSVKAARRLKRSQRVVVFIAAIGMMVATKSLMLWALPKPASEPSIESTPNSRAEENLKITVWVYNYAQASSWTLIRAERVATSIFRQAGVETLCLNGARSKGRRQPFGPTILALRIVSEPMAARYGCGSTTLGFAVPSLEGGTHASVFYHRVKELAKGTVETEPEILGHALAHETGHLLLDSTMHYPTGIMHTSWSREDLHQMAWQYLSFSTEQAEVLRANVLRRIKRKP